MTSRPFVWGSLLLVVTVGIGVATMWRGRGPQGEEVRVAPVVKRGVTSRVLAQGKVRARTQVDVSSEVAGRIADVHVKVGDVVRAGQPLFSLDGEQLKNAVQQIAAALDAAKALRSKAELAVAEAQRALARDQPLRDQGVLPDDALQLDQSRLALAQADRAQAQANIERTEIDLQRAQDALRRARVVAPSAGTVVAVGIEKGQVVSSVTGLSASPDASLGLGIGGTGAPVVLADLDALIVRLDVDELDVASVHPGQRAIVKAQGLKDVEFEGVVNTVGLMGREVMGAVLFAVEVKVERSVPARDLSSSASMPPTAPEGSPAHLPAPREVLRPGMSASADIEVEHLDDALTVPVAAVLEATRGAEGGDKGDRVFVVDGTGDALRAHERPVRLGPGEGDVISVLSGLEPGARVVEGPFRVLKSLEDGAAVRVAPDKKGDAKKGAAQDDDGPPVDEGNSSTGGR